MSEPTPEVVLSCRNSVVVAAAGCGKTELISKTVSASDSGRQLILTHTHAGIRSLISRLEKHGVSKRKYHLDTIAGFCLKYAISFPRTGGISISDPTQVNWDEVYSGCSKIFDTVFGREILRASFTGVFVDEYQDCTKIQHEIVLRIAKHLPTKLFGDPLQGIFEFEDGTLVNWEDFGQSFERLPDLVTPWRWINRNPNLGDWLIEARRKILQGVPVSLRSVPRGVYIHELTVENQLTCCFDVARNFNNSTIVAIHKWPNEAHSLARSLKGVFVSMEEVECRDLLSFSDKFQDNNGRERVLNVIEFAARCMTKVSTELKTIKDIFASGRVAEARITKNRNIFEKLKSVFQSSNLQFILESLVLIENISGSTLFRQELFGEMKRSLKLHLASSEDKLRNTAWKIRDKGRHSGRKVRDRIVSRTLLIKGLEFDHAIVSNIENLSMKEKYVSITRGSKTLSILTNSENL